MERHRNFVFVTLATTFTLLLFSTTSVLGRPHPHHRRAHVRPILTLADLDEDGAIPKKEEVLADDIIPYVDDIVPEEINEIRFEAVDLPSQFETYDLNHDQRVSLLELAMVTGTKEVDAIGPFNAADKSHDNKISFEEFKAAPWILGAEHEVDNIDTLIHDFVGEDV